MFVCVFLTKKKNLVLQLERVYSTNSNDLLATTGRVVELTTELRTARSRNVTPFEINTLVLL
jgi:hypothetical protein